MPTRRLWATALAIALLPLGQARGQTLDVTDDQPKVPSQWFGMISLVVAQPLGEFADYISVGGGFSGSVLYRVSRTSPLAIRTDIGYIVYGSEEKRINPFPRLQGDITTTNSIVYAGIGPQLMLPDGMFRPYLGGSIGLSYFFTESSLDGIVTGSGSILQTTNFDDATFAYTGAAGVYVPLRRGMRPVSLDIGVRYHANGRASYLREGSIQDNPDNTITITPIESETNLLTWHLGVAVRF